MTGTWLHEPDPAAPCTIIAEVAQAHEGSLGMAHAFIDTAADCGADAVKFQTHIAHAESTAHEPWRKRLNTRDVSRYDYWRRMEFSRTEWQGLKAHADERGLLFISSPFSIEAVELLEDVGVCGFKIASGEVANGELLDRIAQSARPVVLSTGLSSFAEIDDAHRRFADAGIPVAVLQCSSVYPCPPERIGLNVIGELRARYGGAVGLSDHSATIYPGLAAAALGINVLEVHLTLSRHMFGPDVVASLDPAALSQLVDGVRFIETMRRHPVDKHMMSQDMHDLRAIFTRSVVAARDLPAGTVLEREHLALKKPGSGLPAARLPELIGKALTRAIARDALLEPGDTDPACDEP